MTQLVVVTGPDGAGKSSVCARLADLIGPAASVIDIWRGIDDSPFRSCKGSVHDYLKVIDSTSRAFLILHTLSRSLHQALATSPSFVIADGYWYKYAVTELALNGDQTLMDIASSVFPKSNETFFLDVKPQTAFKRKSEFSSYESGFSDDERAQAFIRFQSRIYDKWQTLRFLNPNWETIDTGAHSAHSAADYICSRILKR